MRRPGLTALACCVLFVASATPAAAAPVPLNRVQIAFTMPTGDHSVWLGSAANCLIFTGGWSLYSTQRFRGATSRPSGLLDVGGRNLRRPRPDRPASGAGVHGHEPRTGLRPQAGLSAAS